MLSVTSSTVRTSSRPVSGALRSDEGGYTLVALLAFMTIVALLASAAAPGIYQQAQREREIEAIFRGEQVAEGIRRYYVYNQQRVGAGEAALPTSIEKMLEGLPVGTRKVQVLRPSAAKDILSSDGEWRLVRPRSTSLSDFQGALMVYAENIQPATNDPQLKQIEQLMAPPMLPTLGLASSGSSTSEDNFGDGPFIGVVSASKQRSVINYYGIETHNGWVFTPLFR